MTASWKYRGLRRRTFLLGSTAWLAFVGILLTVSLLLVRRGFREVESREFTELSGRAHDLLDSHLEQLAWKGRDWAEWDAADNWLRGGGNGFAEENLNDSALAILGESSLAYFHSDGLPASVLGINLVTRRARVPDTNCLRSAIPSSGSEPRLGLFRCGDRLLALSATAVRNSLGKGGVSGWFVIAHEMDGSKARELGALLGHPLKIIHDSILDEGVRLVDSIAVLSVPYPILNDSVPIYLQAKVGRPVRLVSARIQSLLVVALLCMAISGTLLSLWILETFVVRRVLRLSSEVVAFSEGDDLPPSTFSDRGPDEIGALGDAIDGLVHRLLTALDAAQAAARAKGAFLASISHDLRTPLNGMIGLNEVLLKTSLDEPQREAMGLLRSASENLLAMINDILEYSRSEAGHAELQSEDAPTEDVFFQPIRVLAPIAHHQGIELLLRLDPDLPSSISIDSPKMRQILHNLVGNAIKFTESGEVCLEVQRIRQGSDSIHLRVSVSDTGTGIPEDCLETIFVPFMQASPEIGKRQGGTGLGLSISRQMVAQMGGTLTASSRVGEGSTFRFEIEVPVPQEAHRLVPLVFPWSPRGDVVLFLSSASLRDSMVDLLERLELKARCISSLDDLEPSKESIALFIADVASLGFEDLPLLERFRGLDGGAECPVVVLSRTDRLHDDELCRRRGVGSVLRSPAPPSVLMAAIERSLRPALEVFLAIENPFLRTMLSSMLDNRGHRVRIGSLSNAPDWRTVDVCILDGEADSFRNDWSEVVRLGPNVVRIQLGGSRMEGDHRFLERPFSAESFHEILEAKFRASHRAG